MSSLPPLCRPNNITARQFNLRQRIGATWFATLPIFDENSTPPRRPVATPETRKKGGGKENKGERLCSGAFGNSRLKRCAYSTKLDIYHRFTEMSEIINFHAINFAKYPCNLMRTRAIPYSIILRGKYFIMAGRARTRRRKSDFTAASQRRVDCVY